MAKPEPATSHPAFPAHPGDLARGGSQSSVRLYNERLVLSLIRRYGSLPKAKFLTRRNDIFT